MDPESEKLEALARRIEQAGGHALVPKPVGQVTPSSAGRIGFDFVGTLAGSGIIGALLDRAFGTQPWGLLGMILIGFVVGIVNAWRVMQKSED